MRQPSILAVVAPWLVGLVLGVAACGGDGGTGPGGGGTPFTVTTVQPSDGSTDVETGAVVIAQFSGAAAPATVTPQSFTLSIGGTALATAVTYDAGSRTAQLAAPLVPGATYQAAVTTAVQDASGQALAQPRRWSFSTRSWQSVAVDQGGVGQYTSLALDRNGRLHVSYYDRTNGHLKYSMCATDCATATNWQSVTVDQTGNVGGFTSLAVDGSGRLHVSYEDFNNADLKYATCATDCATATNWQSVTVDQTGDVGGYTSLAVDRASGVHAIYYDFTNRDLKYATCAGGCATAANWRPVAVDQPGDVGGSPSLAVDGTGRLHVS